MYSKIFFLICVIILSTTKSEAVCIFTGAADFKNKDFQLGLDFGAQDKITSRLKVEGEAVFLSSQLERLKIGGADLTTEVETSLYPDRNQIRGLIWTRYTLFNHKPFKELSGSFIIKDGRLTFDRLNWAEMNFSGWLDLLGPFNLDITVEITDMDLSDLASLLGLKFDEVVMLSGVVSGKVRLSGYFKRLKISGILRSEKVQIDGLAFRNAAINFHGQYPVVDVENSEIRDENGMVYNLSGKFNLRQINKFSSGAHQITVTPFSDDAAALKGWTIRRIEDLGNNSQWEFGYRLRSDSPAQRSGSTPAGILELERTHRF
ncbi:MAG: hypothetical protein ACOY3D_02765 [Candidatus Omnitrophota bacterium]